MSEVKPVKEILGERSTPTQEGPGAETVVFQQLAAAEFPDALKSSFFVGGVSAIATVLIGLVCYNWNTMGGPIYQGIALLCIGGLVAVAFMRSRLQKIERDAAADDLMNWLLQFKELGERLATYRADFDQRTSKYFHLITTNKVQAYFVLAQFQSALEKRITALEVLLERPTRTNLAAAHTLFTSDIVITDGATEDSGTKRSIEAVMIERTLAEIISNLEADLAQLEKEISRGGSSESD
jgi:hypothetical protein